MTEELRKIKQELYKKDIEIRELRTLTTKDPLTRLYNRRGFEEEADRLFKDITFARQNPEARKHFYIDSISLLFFDIDNFKKLNDAYGHKIGDQILKRVSEIIIQKVRSIDFVGRWGGEEIIAALVGSHEKDAYQKADEIRKAIKSRVRVPGSDEPVTVSIGVAALDGVTNLGELVKRSDKAMYSAKYDKGKDNVVKYSELKDSVR